MHPRNSIGPLSPIGHPLSPTSSSLLSSASGASSQKSRRRSTISRRVGSNASSHGKAVQLQCSVCLESLDPRAFARPQRIKDHGATCRTCVWKTLSRNNSQDGSPGLTSSSSSLSSYSECPTSYSVPPASISPLCRNNSNSEEEESSHRIEQPLPGSLEAPIE